MIDRDNVKKKGRRVYYSMGEVAEMFDVNPSLIRYWETQFDILKPDRNKKGNRLFRPQDIESLKIIYYLVREKGMTLEGAQKRIRDNKEGLNRDIEVIEHLQTIRALLEEIREELKMSEDDILIEQKETIHKIDAQLDEWDDWYNEKKGKEEQKKERETKKETGVDVGQTTDRNQRNGEASGTEEIIAAKEFVSKSVSLFVDEDAPIEPGYIWELSKELTKKEIDEDGQWDSEWDGYEHEIEREMDKKMQIEMEKEAEREAEIELKIEKEELEEQEEQTTKKSNAYEQTLF